MEFSDPSLIQRRVSTPRVNKTDSEGSSIKGNKLNLLINNNSYIQCEASNNFRKKLSMKLNEYEQNPNSSQLLFDTHVDVSSLTNLHNPTSNLERVENNKIQEQILEIKKQSSSSTICNRRESHNLTINDKNKHEQEEIKSRIREVTKSVFLQLSDYISDVRDKSPMFGFPGMCFSPINKANKETNWQKITKIIVDPTFKQKHSFL